MPLRRECGNQFVPYCAGGMPERRALCPRKNDQNQREHVTQDDRHRRDGRRHWLCDRGQFAVDRNARQQTFRSGEHARTREFDRRGDQGRLEAWGGYAGGVEVGGKIMYSVVKVRVVSMKSH